ncbi:lipase [Devosia insulae DS-56]|uniref:Lipase n=1 Tax=Devosia insulae DS-56 TaxID=1116389 RepID=A0A1E5XIT9_9HYPH|nr:alpha/beta hydrolase [Devosia insulae]OEO28509.1 lipase [Devosia insulae DS-56]
MHKGIPHPAELERSTQAFVDGLAGGKPIQTLTPLEARAVLSSVQQAANVTLPNVQIKDVTLPIGPTGQTNIRVIRPEGATGVLPVIVYMHGGGWVLGDRETHDRLIRELSIGANAALVFVDYERSPEARHPVAIEQGYAVAKHIAANADMLSVDANRMVIAGDSVGGNMAAVIALLAKERQGPAFKAQLLFYPVTDASLSTKSYEEFAEGPWLTKAAMAWYWEQYIPDAAQRLQTHASPVNATSEELAGLPQTLLIVDENDVLRDEGEEYGRKLAEAGVRVTSVRYNGTIHDFVMLNALTATPAVRGAIGQAQGYLRYVFSAS